MKTTDVRKVKTSRQWQGRSDSWAMGMGALEVPWIRLGGLWLQRAGFSAGDYLEVKVRKGKLIIKKSAVAYGDQSA